MGLGVSCLGSKIKRVERMRDRLNMKKLPCSAPLLTLNSYQGLVKLLPFLVERFEDVYILDGNSTDGTIELARSMGVRVEKQFETDLPNQRISDFRAMRLRLWALARFDWLFTLDSDELVTPECFEAVRRVIIEDKKKEAHSFCRLMQRADGKIVQEAFSYPDRYIRLFRRSDGITLANRRLHERMIVPNGVKTILHDEGITSEWLPPSAYFQKSKRYLEIEAQSVFSPSITFWLHWIVYYNIRSFAGQSLKAIYTYIRAAITGRVAMPIAYTKILLWYRLAVMGVHTKAWWRSRAQSRAHI